MEAMLRRVDEAVGKLHGALQANTLLMLYTGQVRHFQISNLYQSMCCFETL